MRALGGDANRVGRTGNFDAVDQRLLELLAGDGRLSARRLGREVGMSPGAISERVARLERVGAIRGYHADVDPSALGFGMEVIVGLQTEQGPSLDETLSRLESVPEIQRVYVVSGQWDLVLHIRVRDQDHLREMILGSVWHVPAFRHSETLLVLESRQGSVTWFAGLAGTANGASIAVSEGPDHAQTASRELPRKPVKSESRPATTLKVSRKR